MPSRKRDARRSDASATSMPLNDDEEVDDSAMAVDPPPPPPEKTPAEPSASSSMPPPARPGSADKGSFERKEREREVVTIEDLSLPKSIITRLAKGVLPANTQIQANAITAMSKSAIVFVNHLASAANELTVSANKKTIMPEDVFRALDEVEYGFMRQKLEAEFAKFSNIQSTKRSSYRKKVAEAKKAATGPDTSVLSTASTMPDDAEDPGMLDGGAGGGAQQPRAKKAKTVGGGETRDTSAMDVDGHDMSDAETIPDELQEDEGDEDERQYDTEEDDQDDDDDDEEQEGDETNGDLLEEHEEAHARDEALDGDESE